VESDDKSWTGRCIHPVKTSSGDWVRCQSRQKSKCESCAELYRGDWAAIARSGVFDPSVEQYRFYLLTLTAPSFGRVHRVPRSVGKRVKRCGCGETHGLADVALRGVPLDPSSYDYLGQVAWNRDAGVLWDRTRRRVRDRWDTAEFFLVREWQDRGVLHLHVLVRIERVEAPSAGPLREASRTAVAASKIDGSIVEWGEQVDAVVFRADGDGAKTILYLSKALNYVMKDTARAAMSGRGSNFAWAHLAALGTAARRMRCSSDCVPEDCPSRVHDRYGSRSHVVSASRRTMHRTGWSFSALTRKAQRLRRREWMTASESAPATDATPAKEQQNDAVLALADSRHRVAVARAAALP
jgi:hypothetical protein